MDRQPEEPRGRVGGAGLLAGAIVAAALIVSWGISRSSPHYQLASSGSAVVRMDTDSGELIACTTQGCMEVEEPDRAKTFEALGLKAPPTKPEPAKVAGAR